MTPEFSRLERVDAIGVDARVVMIDADAAERAALARRFGLVSVERLSAEFRLAREGDAVAAAGRVLARVTQACSVTGEPLTAAVDEAVALRFVTEPEPGEELELTDAALDTLPIEHGAIDLGEAAAETMALALDPFPRGPGAAAALAQAGVLSEDPTGPFAGLAALKAKPG